MFDKGNSDSWDSQSDPFDEDFFLMLPEEEIRARAEQMLRDNRDALRHYIELLVWEVQGSEDFLRVAVPLLWEQDGRLIHRLGEDSPLKHGGFCGLSKT